MGPALDDDMPLSMDAKSAVACPGPQPRQPDGLMGRRPRPLLPSAVVHRATPRRWVGGQARSARSCLKENGLGAEAPSPVHPTPAAAPRRRRQRPTTRPAREPCLTGPFLGEGEPADVRLATESGTNAYRDRSGRCPRHSRPALRSGAAGVRRSVGCGSSMALGPGAASVADSQAGSPRGSLRHDCCHPGADAKSVIVPGKGNSCLLTVRAL